MNDTRTIVVLLLLATSILASQLFAFLTIRRTDAKSATYMAYLMAACAWWAGFNILEYFADKFVIKLFFANLEYLAITTIPIFWYAFGRSFNEEEWNGKEHSPSSLIWIVPAISAIFVWLDPLFGLMRSNMKLKELGHFIIIEKNFGPWFWIHSAYSYIFIVLGMILIIRGASARGAQQRGNHKKAQIILLTLSVFIPTLANILYIFDLLPIKMIDPTPLAFTLTCALLIVNLSRFRFLSLVSAAREESVENLRDPLLVFNKTCQLVYMNKIAKTTFNLNPLCLGKNIEDLGPLFASIHNLRVKDTQEILTDTNVKTGNILYYEVKTSIVEQKGRSIGTALALYDITRRTVAENAYIESNHLLEERIVERTKALEESNLRMAEELEHRTRAERQLSHSALHDPLTGLPNRSLLLSRIEQAIARFKRDSSLAYGILFIDFDGFKDVNDSFGHDAGDAFLCEVASRLRHCVREVDTVARLGGDEFVVLLDGLDEAFDIGNAADRIADELSIPLSVGHNSIIPSASIGVLTGNTTLIDAREALRNADIAMYRAKAGGKNKRVLFEEEMLVHATEKSRLSKDLRKAIGTEEIYIVFQPIVHMDGAPAGWEVLARWKHKELGPIGPDRFIPIAEASGLIIPLGTFVLLETLKTAVTLRNAGLILQNDSAETPFFAVNVSAVQLTQSDFAELVLSSIDRSGLPRAALHLEITESAIIQNRDAVITMLERLSAEGISFKLDDFGTGYSSLGYLDRIPIDTVKIDRSFIVRMDEPDADPIKATGLVKGIISLSHELGKTVVAEGIETEAQAKALTEYGCDFAQGYYFGKPIDSDALALSLAKLP